MLVSHLSHITLLRRQRVVVGSRQLVATTSGKADTLDMLLQDVGGEGGCPTRGAAGTGVYLHSCIRTAGTVTLRRDRHRLAQGR